MSDTTQATDPEREAARQIVAIVQGIERGRKASRQQFAQWETAVSLGAAHLESEEFREELCRQAAETWPNSALMLAVFVSHCLATQPAVAKA